MKKFYATLMMFFMCIVAFAQDTKTITIVCDDYEYLNVYQPGSAEPEDILVWNADTKSVQAVFGADIWSCRIEAKEGYEISGIYGEDGYNMMWGADTSYILSRNSFNDGETLKVTVKEHLPKVAYVKGNAEQVYLEFNDVLYNADNQVDGQWKIAISDDDYGSINITAYDGYQITKVYNTTNDRDFLYIPSESAFISIYSLEQCDNFVEITSVDLSEVRTSTFTLEVVGDPASVSLKRNGSATPITLTEGINEIKFDPVNENPFQIQSAISSYSYIYKVTNNGVAVPRAGYMFRLDAANGDEVVVYPDFPEGVTVPVSFAFTNENTEDAILKVTVNNEEVDRSVWSSPDFTVDLGAQIAVYFNNVYQFKFYKDGSEQMVYGSYSTTILDEVPVLFTVTAEKQPVYLLNIDIDDPSHIVFNSSGVVVNLVPGMNTVEVLQGYNYIQINPSQTGIITSITTDPELENPIEDFNRIYIYGIANDMVMTIRTEEFVRGNKGIVYLEQGTSDQPSALDNGWLDATFYLGRVNGIAQQMGINLQAGYNFFDWNDADAPFYLSMYPEPAAVYMNGELIERGYYPYYEGLKDFTNNGVIKIFATEPTMLTATLSIEKGLNAVITTDFVNEHPADATALNVLPGTWVTIAPEASENLNYYVYVNDLAVEADENGVYGFTVTENCQVSLSSSPVFPTEFNITADSENVTVTQGEDDGTYVIMVEGSTYEDNVTISFERPEGWDGVFIANIDELYAGMKKVPAEWPTIDMFKEVYPTLDCQKGLDFTLPADGLFHLYMGMLYIGDQLDIDHSFMIMSNVSKSGAPAFPEKLDITTNVEGLTISQEPDPLGGIVVTIDGECAVDELTVTVATPEGWDGFVGHVIAEDPNVAPLADQIFWMPVADLLAEGMEKTNTLTFAVPEEKALQIGEMFLYTGERADFGRIVEIDVNVAKQSSAIDAIGADSISGNDVYNLQGILVKAAATAEDLKALPAGLYIVGGKKVVIR